MIERLEDRITPAVHDLTQNTTFATIQAAVNAANSGDTILADPGVYAESVTVDKSVVLEGAQHGVDAQKGRPGAFESVLDAATDNGQTLFNITANDVTIDGFTIQNATNPNQFGFGIRIGAGTSGTSILNNIVQNNIAGISLANNSTANQTVIGQNLIQNNNQAGPISGTGIYSDQFNAGGTVTNILIDNNNQPGPASGAGIYTDPFVDGGNLTDVLIDSNTFSGNTGDAGIDFSSTQTGSQSNVTISNNVFSENARAVFLLDVVNSAVTQNSVTGSTAAGTGDIRIFGGVSGLTVANNLLQGGAGDAIKINDGLGGNPNANITINDNSNNA